MHSSNRPWIVGSNEGMLKMQNPYLKEEFDNCARQTSREMLKQGRSICHEAGSDRFQPKLDQAYYN